MSQEQHLLNAVDYVLFRRYLKNPAKFNNNRASSPIKPGVSASCTRYVWHFLSTCHDSLCPVRQVPNIIWASLLVRSQRFAPWIAVQYFSTAKICLLGWANLKVSRIFAGLSIYWALFFTAILSQKLRCIYAPINQRWRITYEFRRCNAIRIIFSWGTFEDNMVMLGFLLNLGEA